jgi:type II secretory pathway component PulL
MSPPRFSLRTLLIVVLLAAIGIHFSPMALEKYQRWEIEGQFDRVRRNTQTTEGWNRYAPEARHLNSARANCLKASRPFM